MANEITELGRVAERGHQRRRVRLLLLFPITDPMPGVVPTPSENLPTELPPDVPTVAERAALDAGTLAFQVTHLTDRTDIPVDLERRTFSDRQLADPEAEQRKRGEEDALYADQRDGTRHVWDAGLQHHYASKLAQFSSGYDARYRTPLRRINAGGR